MAQLLGSFMTKTINFEQSIEELENIVGQLEKGELPLEDSLKQFEKGINLAQKCQTILTQAEQKIEMLTTNKERPDESINE